MKCKKNQRLLKSPHHSQYLVGTLLPVSSRRSSFHCVSSDQRGPLPPPHLRTAQLPGPDDGVQR